MNTGEPPAPLYLTDTISGKRHYGGIWRALKDEKIPLADSLQTILAAGGLPDWLEMLADAGSRKLPGFDFDEATSELRTIDPSLTAIVIASFEPWFDSHSTAHPEDTLDCVCRRLLAEKKRSRILTDGQAITAEMLQSTTAPKLWLPGDRANK